MLNRQSDQQGFVHPGLLVVGVTGGMAAGKSSAMVLLQRALDCESIDSDQVCRELVEPKKDGWKLIQQEFGDLFFHENNELDRVKLRNEVFDNDEVRNRLNSILHPVVKDEISSRIEKIADQKECIVLVEVPLLYEAGWGSFFDIVVVVAADDTQRLDRLMKRDKVALDAAQQALASQWPQEDKMGMADYVVDNSGDQQSMGNEIHILASLIRAEYDKKKT